MNCKTFVISGFLILSFLQLTDADPGIRVGPKAGLHKAEGVRSTSLGQGGASASSPDESELRRVYPIRYASASYLADVINEVYGAGETLLTPEQIYGFRRSGLAELSAIADAGVMPTDSPYGVKADCDDYSNSVIVRANAEQQSEIAAFLIKVDHADTPIDSPYVIPLIYVRAIDMVPVVQAILDGEVPLGRTAGEGGAGGLVSADIESNSLVVITDPNTIVDIESVLGQIDCAPEMCAQGSDASVADSPR